MEKFEYKRENFDFAHEKENLTDWLNRRGENGWELVSVVPDYYLVWICFFKRKIKINMSSYIARDKDNSLNLFNFKPKKCNKTGKWLAQTHWTKVMELDQNKYPEVTWENSPLKIELKEHKIQEE